MISIIRERSKAAKNTFYLPLHRKHPARKALRNEAPRLKATAEGVDEKREPIDSALIFSFGNRLWNRSRSRVGDQRVWDRLICVIGVAVRVGKRFLW